MVTQPKLNPWSLGILICVDIISTSEVKKTGEKIMAKDLVLESIAGTAQHVINKILIRRLEEIRHEVGDTYEERISYYKSMLKSGACGEVAVRTMNMMRKNLGYLPVETLKDLISNVSSSTIQDRDTEWRKRKKSTNGFWEETFDMKARPQSFEAAFPYVFYRAVFSESRNVFTRLKHETVVDDFEGGGNVFDLAADTRDPDKKTDMEAFEDAIRRFRRLALKSVDMDVVDRAIFLQWFIVRNGSGDFGGRVNMLRRVYMPVQRHIRKKGMSMTTCAMHYRWKRIESCLRGCFSSSGKLNNPDLCHEGVCST